MKHLFVIAISWIVGTAVNGQAPSVLSSGQWAKISVNNDAVYKIDYNLFQQMGFNPNAVDARNIRIYAGTAGMLPQSNQDPRIADLQQLAVYFPGGNDGTFDAGDLLLFFGEGPDHYSLDESSGSYLYENHLYSDKNFYFVTVGTTPGKRMGTLANLAGSFPTVNTYDDFLYYEKEQYNELHSGRDWFGEQFDSQTEYTVRFEMSGITNGSFIKVISSVMGQSYSSSSFQLFLNDVPLGEQLPPAIINSQFEAKGSKVTDTFSMSASTAGAPSRTNQDVKIKFLKASSGRSVGYLDHLLLQATRKLALYGEQSMFQSLSSLQNAVSAFSVSAMPPTGTLWDVTDTFNAKVQAGNLLQSTFTFSANTTTLHRYIALSNRTYTIPVVENTVPNQNLHKISSVDLLIVTAPDFLADANRLASHRAAKNSLKVTVVTTTQIYNEFSGGKQDVTAIRDAVKYLFDNGSGLQYLLLFGRGSYDYKDYLTFNKNYVPIYESRNSLDPLETYASDDYFGFLDANEGNWGENPPEDHTLDISVGRLPVMSTDDAKTVVDKIIQYESGNWGDWRKTILFVADDGDFSIHQIQSNQLAEIIEAGHPEINTKKIFLDAFNQTTTNLGERSPDATESLVKAVRNGAVIVNYTGHGNEQQWMQEAILDPNSLDRWKTKPRYPLLVTATCEFGRNDDPGAISTAELSIIQKDGGSIGLVTTSRPVNSNTNFTLNNAFYQSLFVKSRDSYRAIGSVFMDTKNNSLSGVSNRNFSLLADPSMHLALPDDKLVLTSVSNLTSGSDTLKGLSKVKLSGEVRTQGALNSSFEGKLQLTIFDKREIVHTLGNENPPFQYSQWDNRVFRGQASVHQGQFDIEFVMPAFIDPAVSYGKMSFYAHSQSGDVAGADVGTKIGALEPSPGTDTEGPDVELFIGDTTFVNGGISNVNTHVVAKLHDENGINTSTYDDSHTLLAVVDGTTHILLSDYYQSTLEGYQYGKIDYAFLENLKPGTHYITLRASDTFGNTTTTPALTFFVSDQSGIQIEQLLNYPNPFDYSTTFHFKHNRSGEDLEVMTVIYNIQGQTVMSADYQVPQSSYQVDLPAWDATLPGGTKLTSGLYLLKLSVRSLLDGSKNEKITKVIILD